MRVFIKDTLDLLKGIFPEEYEEKRCLDVDEIGPEKINSFVADIFVPKMINEMNENEKEEVYGEVYVNGTITDGEDITAIDTEQIAREAADEAWESYLRYRATKDATCGIKNCGIKNKSNIPNVDVEYDQTIERRSYKSPKWSWKNECHYRKNRSWKVTTHATHQWARHAK